ncbi:MAG TPA: hypothetical protein VFF29_00950 [Bacteroidota bacterium]|nr:hypothetical protein [Bacteroidota bacterium]
MRKHLFLAVFCLISLSSIVFAQEVRVTARVDSNTILIGDWIKLYLEVQHPEHITVTWPTILDSLEGFDVLHREEPTPKKYNQGVLEASTYTLTVFDSGTYVIPPIAFHYTVRGDTVRQTAQTSPFPIFVRSIAVDTTQGIKDIKPPLMVPITFADVLPYIIGVIIIAGLVWLVLYIRRKRAKGETLLPQSPPRPPHEIALEALQALESEHLWQRGKVKEYHSQLTDIVRVYIEKRFFVLAMELTTEEILSAQKMISLSKEVVELLKEILIRADLVKFAKFQPLPEENELSMARAKAFVESTMQDVKEINEEEQVEEVKV